VGKFDRYLLSQLMVLFGFFSLVLVLVYWINRAVVLFDQLIANGQSAIVFLEFTALSLPNVIRLVLPVSAIAATIYATNRLASESELVIVQATGFSPFRLARAVLAFGLIVGLLVGLLTNFLVPLSATQLSQRSAEISQDATARLLRQGTFLNPSRGVTFYIGEITPDGELEDVFFADARDKDERRNYSARSALLIRDGNVTNLVLFDGVLQILDTDTQILSTTSFRELTIDASTIVTTSTRSRRNASQLSTLDLLNPTPEMAKETRNTEADLYQRGHNRISQILMSVDGVLIAFAAMLVGGFSRFGLWRQITSAVVLLILLKSFDNAVSNIVRSDASQWPLIYAPTIVGLGLAGALLWLSARPNLLKRRRAKPA